MSIDVELAEIRESSDGVLRPAEVVAYASDPDTDLHNRFEWDDQVAGHEHRLWQARMLIRIRVTHLDTGRIKPTEVSEYVSLPSDRVSGDGYRLTVAVLDNEEQREELLEAARRDLNVLRRKYATLKELADLWPVIDAIVV